MTIEQILRALPRLSKMELGKLNTSLKALKSITGNTSTEITHTTYGEEAWVLSLIIEQFKAMGVGYSNVVFLQKPPYYKSFCEKIPALMEYIAKSNLTKAEKSLIIREGIELLYLELAKVNKVVTERTIMLYFHRIVGVLQKNFPDYGQCGFLKFIIQS
jgi:hypothetical protein